MPFVIFGAARCRTTGDRKCVSIRYTCSREKISQKDGAAAGKR
ncbi:hypothetical protein SELSPUOL_01919 [Selenomonas sputigena ATCC 35185]|uniref:Uncharacterized protein n=1 Tax=Selenomonas sputigena (strain ATCC 35185 / DSM 20758 / CCUG 44933 / VPI D19B-28) TaxID=546271 RepID=C9LWR4_SELS3|nr:hypothetical protein SELSPUOL_01919 [Selenomonas sputigena ATCC 35185]